MLKLILIFQKSIIASSISSAENLFFFQLKQQFTYFLSIIQWKRGWNKDIFIKKSYV